MPVVDMDIFSERLKDPLSEPTRKTRRSLLAFSSLGIAVIYTGLLPSKISGLGIEFQAPDQKAFLIIVAAVVFYFLTSFLLYGAADFMTWILPIKIETIDDLVLQYREDFYDNDPVEHHCYDIDQVVAEFEYKCHRNLIKKLKITKPISILRTIFDFALPIVLGISSIIILWRAAL